jgi:hypothetical protein
MEEDEYEHESECEDYADYGAEGYHPVVLGTHTIIHAKSSKASTPSFKN